MGLAFIYSVSMTHVLIALAIMVYVFGLKICRAFMRKDVCDKPCVGDYVVFTTLWMFSLIWMPFYLMAKVLFWGVKGTR